MIFHIIYDCKLVVNRQRKLKQQQQQCWSVLWWKEQQPISSQQCVALPHWTSTASCRLATSIIFYHFMIQRTGCGQTQAQVCQYLFKYWAPSYLDISWCPSWKRMIYWIIYHHPTTLTAENIPDTSGASGSDPASDNSSGHGKFPVGGCQRDANLTMHCVQWQCVSVAVTLLHIIIVDMLEAADLTPD